MPLQLTWLVFVLFIVHHRLADSKWHSRYSVEKLLKIGLKSLDRTTDGNNEADDNEDSDEFDDADDETATESTPKEPGKLKSGALVQREVSSVVKSEKTTGDNKNFQRKLRSLGSSADKPGGATLSDVTTTHQTMQQTSSSSFPGAYQGYMPVSSNNARGSNINRSGGGSRQESDRKRSVKTRHHLHDLDGDGLWRRVAKHTSYRKKNKTFPVGKNETLSKLLQYGNRSNTNGLQMTVVKSCNCTKSSSVETDILKSVWLLQEMVHKLGPKIEKGVRKLGNQGVDNTNEERADIKTNSDRISQLQQGLSGKVDDLRYNISILMSSQRELGRSVSGALENMMDVLKQMVTMVTGKENNIENRDSKIVKKLANKLGKIVKKPANKPGVKKKPNTANKASKVAKSANVKDLNKNASAKNTGHGITQVKAAGNNRRKEETAARKNAKGFQPPKLRRKIHKNKRKKHSLSADNIRRRTSNYRSNTSFHNDHAIVNKFKNDYNSKNMPFNQKSVSGGGQKLKKTYGHPIVKKTMPKKTKHKFGHHKRSEESRGNRRFQRAGRKSKDQVHYRMHQMTQKPALSKNKYHSYWRKEKRSESERDIDTELERLLKQELGDYVEQ